MPAYIIQLTKRETILLSVSSRLNHLRKNWKIYYKMIQMKNTMGLRNICMNDLSYSDQVVHIQDKLLPLPRIDVLLLALYIGPNSIISYV